VRDRVIKHLVESARLKAEMQAHADKIVRAAEMIAGALSGEGKVLIFGNGGSAADAQHLAAEFVNRFLIERPPLPAMALSTDTSILTSISNDYSFREVFSKQVQAFGRPGDGAWGISTSGNSPNVIEAVQAARAIGMSTLVMTGAGGGELKSMADLLLDVPSRETPRIQEVHITMGHIICDLVDYLLFQKPGEEVAG
jgi:D-sedoheptulose 7-phosphate isomerase